MFYPPPCPVSTFHLSIPERPPAIIHSGWQAAVRVSDVSFQPVTAFPLEDGNLNPVAHAWKIQKQLLVCLLHLLKQKMCCCPKLLWIPDRSYCFPAGWYSPYRHTAVPVLHSRQAKEAEQALRQYAFSYKIPPFRSVLSISCERKNGKDTISKTAPSLLF